MKCNLKELALLSDAPCVLEGRLNYKKIGNATIRESVFKERWFRLVKNYLFYFRLSEMGSFDTKSPVGVFILEGTTVQMEHGQMIPFAFSLSFFDDSDKRHILAARTQENAVAWVLNLRQSSYEYLRTKMYDLQAKIFAISGYDPLLMVPRNEGAKLWAPAVPFSTAPACTSSTAGFNCHVHSDSHHRASMTTFTLDRSHSDALLANKHRGHLQARDHDSQSLNCAKANKYSGTFTSHVQDLEDSSASIGVDESSRANKHSRTFISHVQEGSGECSSHINTHSRREILNLERSVTTPELPIKLMDSALYMRLAPSPPLRKKSPRMQRRNDSENLIELSKSLAVTNILGSPPMIPPRRKISPREISPHGMSSTNEEDLIKF